MRIEESIYRRHTVGQFIDDADHAQLSVFVELDQSGTNVAWQQEMAVLFAAVAIHAAAVMPLRLVAQIKRVVIRVIIQIVLRCNQVLMPFPGAAVSAPENQFVHDYPHWYASAAIVAVRTVGKGATTAKAGLYQFAIDAGVDQVTGCRHLGPRQFFRQITTRVRRGSIKL